MRPPDAVATTSQHVAPRATPGRDPSPSPTRTPVLGSLVTSRKYLRIFRASLVERMAYRGDFLVGTLLRFLPMVTTILLWQAVYRGSGKSDLDGFRYREMIAYLLLTHISRMFSSMPGLAGGVARHQPRRRRAHRLQPLQAPAQPRRHLIGGRLAFRLLGLRQDQPRRLLRANDCSRDACNGNQRREPERHQPRHIVLLFNGSRWFARQDPDVKSDVR